MKRALAAVVVLLVAAGGGFALGTFVDLRDSGDGTEATPTDTSSDAQGETTQSGGLGGPTGSCDRDDTSGCAPAAEIVVTDGQWRCRQPLAKYAKEAKGRLPLKLTMKFTTYVETSGPVVDLREGCRGDGTEAIDLILDIQGDGRTYGGTADALSVKLDARDIDITGNIDCGPRGPGAHQDGIQAMGARNIAFVDLEVGDWDAQRATCTGASGGIDISHGGITDIRPTNYKCIRCRVVACRRAISIEDSIGVEVTDSLFRSSNPNEREERLATGLIGLCSFGISTCEIHPLAEDYVFERNLCDEFPYEDAPPAATPSSQPR